MMDEDITQKNFELPEIELSNFSDEIKQYLDEALNGFQHTSDPVARG